uniref:Receptor activity-modifying protein 1 n=1 Tax=Lepisosteus oculatus TaxID=7918 RepID=W5MA24_LEPOC
MALDYAPVTSRPVLVWFVIAHHFISVTACDEAFYVHAIEEHCLAKFTFDMEALDPGYWCNWEDTVERALLMSGLQSAQGQQPCVMTLFCKQTPLTLARADMGGHLSLIAERRTRSYGELTNCTYLIAQKMNCFWPNRLVDEFFIGIHRLYFKNCSLSGRLPSDPPNNILGPFIAVPILVTLLMTALVVWRSKRSEGIV